MPPHRNQRPLWERTLVHVHMMSALPPQADINGGVFDVR
jgi:hypothetical protein